MARCSYYVDVGDWMLAEKNFVRVEYDKERFERAVNEYHWVVRSLRMNMKVPCLVVEIFYI